jgi:TetR/AcrR family transcriptional regulator, repressor of fatR-cypB operon
MTERTGDKRDAILDAALELFAERGFHGTAVPLVADKANVGAGTIYRYFPSKESLVNALYLKWKAELGRAITEGFPLSASPREQFHFFWEKCALFAEENPLALKFLELHHHGPYLGDEARRLEQQVLAPALLFLEQTASAKITKPLPGVVLGALVYGAFIGLVKAAWEKRIALTKETLDAAEQCCWEAIRA